MEDKGDLKDIFGPQCCVEADPGGLKEATWIDIFKELNCKHMSTLLSCEDWREKTPLRMKPGERKDKRRRWITFWDQKIMREHDTSFTMVQH